MRIMVFETNQENSQIRGIPIPPYPVQTTFWWRDKICIDTVDNFMNILYLIKGSLDEKLPSYEVLKMLRE